MNVRQSLLSCRVPPFILFFGRGNSAGRFPDKNCIAQRERKFCVSRDFFCLFRRRLEAGIGVLLVVLCFCGNALADSSDIFELSAGEMVFSQRAQFYDVEVGG